MKSNLLIIRKFLKLFSITLLSIFLFSNLVQSKTNDILDCEFMASIAEEKYDFPAGVLSSISNVEAGRISIRNIRRDANEQFKNLEKSHDLSEDNLKRALDNVQELTDKNIEVLNQIQKSKEEELLI